MKYIQITFLTAFFLSLPVHALEAFKTPEIQFRFDSKKPFEVSPRVTLGLEAPVFTDDRKIFLKFSAWNSEQVSGIMSWDSTNYVQVTKFKQNQFPMGMHYNPFSKKLLFELMNTGYFSEGIFSLDPHSNDLSFEWKSPSDLFTSDVSSLAGGKFLLMRVTDENKRQYLSLLNVKTKVRQNIISGATPVFSELGHSTTQGKSISWIFRPQVSRNGKYFSVKLRKGQWKEFSESRPDEIRVYKIDESGKVSLHRTLFDRDSNPRAKLKSFDNSHSVNSKGDLVFGAQSISGRRGLYFNTAEGTKKIASEGGNSWTQKIPHFNADLNDRDEIVFRVHGKGGEHLMYHYNGKTQRLVANSSIIKTDLGDAIVGAIDKTKMTFFSSPRINNLGEVMFGALVSLAPSKTEIGLGFYIIPRAD